MEFLAATLVVVWLLGIAVMTGCVVYTFKHDTSEQTETIRDAMEVNPGLLFGLIAMLIIAWPGTLVYAVATKRK